MSVDLVARALGAKAGRSANTAALIAGIREYGNATRATERLPANDLPTLTLSANGAASTINGNAWYAPTVNFRSELLTYLCGPIVDAGAAHPCHGRADQQARSPRGEVVQPHSRLRFPVRG